ncbi:hypothetical protein CHL76_12125 [Marinococcus halophilus]|uniref:Uncharacterized protein n=1 Tax=Marinococcus halophilus TaxID=1371 RepID=A0A510Y7R8_MARHA|nr:MULTISPECIES: hypothetical protein [Marinococcus]OZT79652.1 hypothetical protein CHL76_12125 [Marinococcus halophilus]GEK59405.1 hypothetical protein MHA01_23100 [Marinococcus halophilus]
MNIIELFNSIDRQTLGMIIVGFIVVHLIVFGFIFHSRSHAIIKVIFGTAAGLHIAFMTIIYFAI